MQNLTYHLTETLNIAVPSGVVSGDPVAVGFIVGVATRNRDSDGESTILLSAAKNVVNVSVEAVSVTGSFTHGSAVAVGDKLYIDAATKVVSKDTGGVLFGYALEAVTSATSDDIDVLMA